MADGWLISQVAPNLERERDMASDNRYRGVPRTVPPGEKESRGYESKMSA